MHAKHTDTASRRIQTCPVVTLDDTVQEPCESESTVTHRVTATASRRWAKLGMIALLGGGLMACNDDGNDDPKPPEECVGEQCDDECTGDECDDECIGDECDAPVVKECLAIVGASPEEGMLAILDTETHDVQTNITTLHHDVGLAFHSDILYGINRLGADNIQAIDVNDGYATAWQYSVGASTNPQTMGISGDRGFIPLLGYAEVMIVDLLADEEEDFILPERIQIPPIAAWDGSLANVGSVHVHDGTLFVVSQGIGDDWACAEDAHSQILAFDTETLEPKAVFDGDTVLDLELCNAGAAIVLNDTLYVQSIGSYGYSQPNPVDDGGIEAYNLSTGENHGIIFTETDGGNKDIFQIYASKDGTGLWLNMASGTAFQDQTLHFLDLSGETPEFSTSFYDGYVWSISESDDFLYVTDRHNSGEGLFVVNKETRTLVSEEPIDIGLPPRDSLLFEREGSCF